MNRQKIKRRRKPWSLGRHIAWQAKMYGMNHPERLGPAIPRPIVEPAVFHAQSSATVKLPPDPDKADRQRKAKWSKKSRGLPGWSGGAATPGRRLTGAELETRKAELMARKP